MSSPSSSKTTSTAAADNRSGLSRVTWIAVLSAIGTVLSLIQVSHFYEVRKGLAGFHSFCDVGTKFSCNAIDASPYAEFLFGFPLSAYVTAWMLGTAIILLIGRSREWRKEAVAATAAMSAIGSVFSLVYLYIMLQILKTYCLLCLVTDAINFATVIVMGALYWSLRKQEGPSPKPLDFAKFKTFGYVLASCFFVILIFSLGMGQQERIPKSAIDEMYAEIMATPPVSINTADIPTAFGPKEAPITIVKFSDFQCPACRLGAITLDPVLKRFQDKIRFVFMNHPLDSSCNRTVPQPMHPVACEAAKTAICVAKKGKFKEYYEKAFENQAKMVPGLPEQLATELGTDSDYLKGCVSSPEIGSELGHEIEQGLSLGVRSTPTFFINGRKVAGAVPIEVWNKVIATLLEKP